jgi:hypothetical protein
LLHAAEEVEPVELMALSCDCSVRRALLEAILDVYLIVQLAKRQDNVRRRDSKSELDRRWAFVQGRERCMLYLPRQWYNETDADESKFPIGRIKCFLLTRQPKLSCFCCRPNGGPLIPRRKEIRGPALPHSA